MVLNNLPKREELLRRKRSQRRLRYAVGLFLFIILVGILSYISHRQKIRISQVELSGGIIVTQSEIEYESLSYMYGSYFWLFPKNNAFLYPRWSLEDHLKEKFKRIDTIDIERKNFKTLIVKITERKPVATWCDFLPDSTTILEDGSRPEVNCYFMDQNSTIFAKAPQFSGDAYFKYYGKNPEGNPVGTQYIPSSKNFNEIVDFVERIRGMFLKPSHLIARENDQYTVVLSSGAEIYFDTKEPLSKVADNLEVLLRTPELSTSSTKSLPVEHVDLRYGNKLFYKLKAN